MNKDKTIDTIDPYQQKFLTLIKKAKDNAEICTIIDEIYEDGFIDGKNNHQ